MFSKALKLGAVAAVISGVFLFGSAAHAVTGQETSLRKTSGIQSVSGKPDEKYINGAGKYGVISGEVLSGSGNSYVRACKVVSGGRDKCTQIEFTNFKKTRIMLENKALYYLEVGVFDSKDKSAEVYGYLRNYE